MCSRQVPRAPKSGGPLVRAGPLTPADPKEVVRLTWIKLMLLTVIAVAGILLKVLGYTLTP